MRHLLKPSGANKDAVTVHTSEGRSLTFYAMDVRIEDGWLILTHSKGDSDFFTTHIPEGTVARIDIKH